jgi:hypothetical protein
MNYYVLMIQYRWDPDGAPEAVVSPNFTRDDIIAEARRALSRDHKVVFVHEYVYGRTLDVTAEILAEAA